MRRSARLRRDGTDIHYEVAGTGRPIVFAGIGTALFLSART